MARAHTTGHGTVHRSAMYNEKYKDYAIYAINLSKRFRQHKKIIWANKNVNLSVKQGRILSLLGPNGAGKTTFIKIIATLVLPDEGSVYVYGNNVVEDAEVVRTKIGLSTGFERSFYYRLTGLQNLLFFGGLYGIPGKVLRKKAEEAMELLGISNYAGVRYMKYSTGIKKRLSIARAFIHNPSLFVFDEPMASIDPEGVAKIREIMRMLKKQGKSILFTTHNIHEAELMSDRVAIMNNGKVLTVGKPSELAGYLRFKILRIKNIKCKQKVREILLNYDIEIVNEKQDEISGKVRNNTQSLGNIIHHLEKAGVEVSQINFTEPGLEDAFMEIIKDSNEFGQKDVKNK